MHTSTNDAFPNDTKVNNFVILTLTFILEIVFYANGSVIGGTLFWSCMSVFNFKLRSYLLNRKR